MPECAFAKKKLIVEETEASPPPEASKFKQA
jgi:hypothetical protein